MTKIFIFLAGQSCRSALNSWAAQQRRRTEDVKILSCTLVEESQVRNLALTLDGVPFNSAEIESCVALD
jgi:hypothetical protein